MSKTDGDTLGKSVAGIRIVRLNTDKTRRATGSTTVYQLYFELSENPPSSWRDIFGREWKSLNRSLEASIDGGFLVMRCLLQEVASMHLPALKRAVEATNLAYQRYAREQVIEEERKADAWKEERRTVEDMAKTLEFS